MRIVAVFITLLTGFPLFAQQKGVTPVSSTQTNATGTTYAVVVGISDYQDPGITDLRFADKDAEAFANYLRSPAGGGLDDDHLKVLVNQEATAGRVAEALDGLLEQVKSGDQVIIYFSGHGDVERKIISQPGFLLCWDAPSRVYMGGGTYSLSFLEAVVTTLSTEMGAQVTVITDACHAGKLSGNQIGGAQLTSANLAKQYANEIKILSCQPNEFSLEGEQWGGGHGCFSHHLIEGLIGLANRNGDDLITVGELDRYLEDHVTAEVAPQSQVPMLLGNKTAALATINLSMLEALKESKTGQLVSFAATDTRGVEDDLLAGVDTSIRKMYLAFKAAVREKHFFQPSGNCAEEYYTQLVQLEVLAPLRGAMTRNYAAALQDDAQQVMNTLLNSGLTEEVLTGVEAARLYGNYPAYLERAASLLGEHHYMYAALQARKCFFEGKVSTDSQERQAAFRKALQWQESLPHAFAEMITTFDASQADSALYYTEVAAKMVPGWVEPYIQLSMYYTQNKQWKKAEEALITAGEADSNSVLVWYRKGLFYNWVYHFDKAEIWLKKALETPGETICFPCAYNSLGYSYLYTGRFDEAEKALLRALELDANHVPSNLNLGNVYGQTGRFDLAEKYLLQTLKLHPGDVEALSNMGIICAQTGRAEEAVEYFKRSIEADANNPIGYANLAFQYIVMEEFEAAEQLYKKMPLLNSNIDFVHFDYGVLLERMQRFEEAVAQFRLAIELNPKYLAAYINLGAVYLTTGQLEASKSTLDNALALNPNIGDTYILLARWAVRSGQTEQAWSYLEQGLEKGFREQASLQTETDFEAFRQTTRWQELLARYFPEKDKD